MDVKLDHYAAFAEVVPAGTDLEAYFGGFDETKWTRAGAPEVEGDTITYRYYYNTILAPEETTGALFSSVTIPSGFTSEQFEKLQSFNITVQAHAIQSEGFGTPAAAFKEYK